jgi:hypothetical protein
MSAVDEEWMAYLKMQTQDRTFAFASSSAKMKKGNVATVDAVIAVPVLRPLPPKPDCEDLNISTKTKALFLNQEVDIHAVFWAIPVIEYWKPVSGVVKKQMKIVSKTPEELDDYLQRLQHLTFYREQIIKQINTVNVRRVKYRDERKLSVGISQKDLLNARSKKKNAFYNCFAIILRINLDGGDFREIHVKIFNTGKMEIPGVLNSDVLDMVKAHLLDMLRPLMVAVVATEPLAFLDNRECDGVLINSNFNCGFNVDRDRLYAILRSDKYGIEAAYDSCSYPGIKCKFYFNHDVGFDCAQQKGAVDESDRGLKLSELGKTTKYTEVSFMIFRTGSCLIVGNCSEPILKFVYDFLKQLFADEYERICVRDVSADDNNNKAVEGDDDPLTNATILTSCSAIPKKQKPRKKTVDMTMAYQQELCAKGGDLPAPDGAPPANLCNRG